MSSPSLVLTKDQQQVLNAGFLAEFGRKPERYFSAPGRTEIGGNHTDHQRGRVLAAAVNLDTQAAVAVNWTREVRILSKGYPLCVVSLDTLVPQQAEINTTPALVRGVCARFAQLGCPVEGFDAYCESTVLPGSGLSSSAAFEVLIGTIVNGLFFEGKVSQPEIAQIGQYAENVFFGKPCGLMDQTASAVGNLVTIDFGDKDHPVIEPVDFDFSSCGHALCIIDSQASHADLTDEYAAIPGELKQVCAYFGKEVLTQIDEQEFFAAIPALRKVCPDRAVLRAIHFYQENARVPQQVAALREGNFQRFLELVNSPNGLHIGMRHISLSTCGVVPGIDALAEKQLQLTLSVSLHAPDSETRSRIMPVNRAYDVEELFDACHRYFKKTGRRISFEYAMIDGVNDHDWQAELIAKKLRGMPGHVNMIPLNDVVESPYKPSRRIAAFQQKLESLGVTATVRRSLGGDIDASCGQLRRKQMQEMGQL